MIAIVAVTVIVVIIEGSLEMIAEVVMIATMIEEEAVVTIAAMMIFDQNNK